MIAHRRSTWKRSKIKHMKQIDERGCRRGRRTSKEEEEKEEEEDDAKED